MQDKKKILVLFAHPAEHKSRINRILIDAISGQENITLRKLYQEYPDFHIDVRKEQEILLEHDIMVWHHPFYWYSCPPLLKEWIDLVLEHGWAYGREGNALKGKYTLSTITTGGGRQAYQEKGYNSYSIPQLLIPFKQTVRLCKMQYLPPFVIHGTHLLGEEDVRKMADDYKRILLLLSDDIFSSEDLDRYEYLNDILK